MNGHHKIMSQLGIANYGILKIS